MDIGFLFALNGRERKVARLGSKEGGRSVFLSDVPGIYFGWDSRGLSTAFIYTAVVEGEQQKRVILNLWWKTQSCFCRRSIPTVRCFCLFF